MTISADSSETHTPVEAPVPGMDPVAVHRWAQRPHAHSAWLHEEVGARMAQRLGWIKATPARWLSWEPVHGGLQAHLAVAAAYPKSEVVVHANRTEVALAALKHAAPEAAGLWGRWRYTPPRLAHADSEVDMVWANMALHPTHQPQTLLKRWHRALRVDGFVMFSCLGPDSLRELRDVYDQMGWSAPAHAFTDMHDWGDMLVQAGFAEPVMDMERITLSYSGAVALLADLRLWGRNLSSHRSAVTRGRSWQAALLASLERHMPRTDDGRLPLTFEVIYGHAHKGQPRVPVGPASAVSLQDMRQMLGVAPSRLR
ncbi:MAG: hypothetical protein RJA09_142 [Pseudomonadota bacterium]